MHIQPDFKLIAVHGGAGFHSTAKISEDEIKRCLKLACKQSLANLENGCTGLDAVETSIAIMEDDPCLNAGYGSNLTFEGSVECDASIMDGRTGDFGATGALSGVKHPISAAVAVLRYSRQPDPLGRIRPIMLVSNGAKAFARAQNIARIPDEDMITPRARDEWLKWLERYNSASTEPSASPIIIPALRERQDTVGAIAWDASGSLAAGVSSGGLLLKPAGRIGEAAIFGAGCWAQQSSESGTERGVACSLSGSGEYITRMMLAKSIGEAVMQNPDEDIHGILHSTLTNFYEMCRHRGETEPSAGIILLVQEVDDDHVQHPRLWCAFTTESMSIAYASTLQPKPKVRNTRLC
ncbi:N-terminal nucleophile aminohydrolase [Trametopsis cervina]|nr:N-terminal nucleophile aminohydrolase [Trametopsis cervina]